MLTVATLLWDANAASLPFSRCYDESWVRKLHDGFARHLKQPFRFVLFTDRERPLPAHIEQVRMKTKKDKTRTIPAASSRIASACR
jgi:hypothetical protein